MGQLTDSYGSYFSFPSLPIGVGLSRNSAPARGPTPSFSVQATTPSRVAIPSVGLALVGEPDPKVVLRQVGESTCPIYLVFLFDWVTQSKLK